MSQPQRTVRIRSDSGTEVTYTVLDDRSDEQALVDAGGFAGRMGNVRPQLVSLVTDNPRTTPDNPVASADDDVADLVGALSTPPRRPTVDAPAGDQQTMHEQYAAAARTVQIRLGPNALATAQRGEPIILNATEADALAEAVANVRDDRVDQLRAEVERLGAELVDTVRGAGRLSDLLRSARTAHAEEMTALDRVRPTTWAYERACAALHAQRARAEAGETVINCVRTIHESEVSNEYGSLECMVCRHPWPCPTAAALPPADGAANPCCTYAGNGFGGGGCPACRPMPTEAEDQPSPNATCPGHATCDRCNVLRAETAEAALDRVRDALAHPFMAGPDAVMVVRADTLRTALDTPPVPDQTKEH